MKFDKIIMNPPYCKNLHLKILEKAIQHLTDDGDCVNLSPVRWLQDPLAQYKKNSDYYKFENSVSKHIESLEEISINDAQNMFNAGMMTMLGIYNVNKKFNNFDYNNYKWKFIDKHFFDKIIFKKEFYFPEIERYNDNDKRVFVPVKLVANPGRTTAYNICTSTFQWIKNKLLPNGENWKTGIYKSKSFDDEKTPAGIWFENEITAKNFYNSTYTFFYKFSTFLVKSDNQAVPLKFLPWMGDEINPRTGKKGYESEWTDADFYKFFNITEDEQKIIEETMERYKNK